LSNKTLSLSGSDTLDKALQQLVTSNTAQLSTCIVEDMNRLRQRYAYPAFAFSVKGSTPAWFARANECSWTGLLCNADKKVNNIYLVSQELQGSIPADVGLLTALTMFDLGFNQLFGSLPSSIGLWTGLKYFSVYSNQLKGSLPSSIGAWTGLTYFAVHINQLTSTVPTELSKWTSIQEAFFHNNMFNGTMPKMGGQYFCPKAGTRGFLSADCKPPAKIQCGCCNDCR
jgi:Leucine-rich repeat (LRR) protein